MSGITSGRLRRFYYPGDSAKPMVPVEWSVASHRVHPMIRNAYAMELTTNGKQSFPNNRLTLFNGTGDANGTNDLHGGLAESSGSINLAYRDLVRGYFFYGLPSGQDVAARMGHPVIDPADLLRGLPTPVHPATVPTPDCETPSRRRPARPVR